MGEHRLRVVRRGESVEEWERGPDGSAEHVDTRRDRFPEEWRVVSVQCSCGVVFEDEEAGWRHLETVAETVEAVDKPMLGGIPADAAAYPVLVDLFPPGGHEERKVMAVEVFEYGRVDASWTAGDLLEAVRNWDGMIADVPYDTVCYRAGVEAGELKRDSWLAAEEDVVMVRVSLDAIVVDAVPAGVPVRVTCEEFAPYEFVNPE